MKSSVIQLNGESRTMLNQLKISTRLNLGFTAILLLMSASLIPAALSKITDVVQQAETRELTGLAKSAQAEIASAGRLAQALSTLVASLDGAQQQFALGDRDGLAKTMVPVFQQLKEDYAVRQFQFHTPPAISFLRAHKPEKFGDDLSGFRATVLTTNRTQKAIQGLEKGVAGLGIRGLSPVHHEGKHIGSVEFGLSFGQPFFEQFKAKYGVDIALHVARDKAFQAFGSTLTQALLSTEQMQQALQGESPILQTTHGGIPYAVMGTRIDDFSGNAVGVLEIAMDRSHYTAAIAGARNITLGIGALALVGGLFIAWIISRSITVPLHKTTAAMNDIAQGGGDLTQRLAENGKDEIASLAAAFNRFAEKVRGMVTQVAGSTASLASSAEEMSVITSETKQGVQEQLAETEQVAAAINEMAATAQSVSTHAADAADAAGAADQEASEGQAVVRHTIETINLLAQDIKSAVGVINALEQNSESIGGVLEVIGAIAEQTNLLALNAAIEAARAGDQGRGFAVVADEVRTLAHRTQESTQEIQNMIESLQAGARDAVSAMRQSNSRSQECVEQAASADASLETITRSIAQINDMNLQIASAAAQQTTVSDEINRNVSNIRGQVERTAQSAQQTNIAGNELAGLAAQLQSLVSQFKT